MNSVPSVHSSDWSSDHIAGWLKQAQSDDPRFHVAPQTIYTWIEQDRDLQHWKTFLRRGGSAQESPRAVRIRRQAQIDGCPAEANQRIRLCQAVNRGKRCSLFTRINRSAFASAASVSCASNSAKVLTPSLSVHHTRSAQTAIVSVGVCGWSEWH